MYKRNMVRRLGIWALITGGILTIPLLANFPWTRSDFIIAFVLIFGFATAYEVVTRNMSGGRRTKIAVIVLLVFVLTWAELAVGLFGTPFAGS